jgi:hypothetical protein
MIRSPADGLEDIFLTSYAPGVLVVYSSSLQFNPLYDKELAHKCIQDAFRHFSATIEMYPVPELRGDVLFASV